MQPRERQLHFRLHAHGTRYPATRTRRPSGQVIQQHGLAHARVTAYYQRPALTGPDRVDKPVQRAALGTPVRHARRAARGAWNLHSSARLYRVPVAWLGVSAHTASLLARIAPR